MEAMRSKLSELGYAEIEEGDILSVTVPKEKLHEFATWLNKEQYFDYLIDIVGMDYGEELGVIYYLSQTNFPGLMLKVKTSTTNREKPRLLSVADLWLSADYYEREVYDMFGIMFINHPDMRRLFLRAEWNGHPLRKDYDASAEKNPIPERSAYIKEMETIPTVTLTADGQLEENEKQLFEPGDYVLNFGPQHPATHGVLHLRASLDGEEIKKLDPNFGYIHRGVEKMCEGYTYPQILHLTDRLDYLSGAINRHAVCLCCEEALELEVPERAVIIRTIFDELTRVASHLLGWGSLCMDMGAVTAFMYGLRDREKIMDIFDKNAGGRLMANYNVIGGVAYDVRDDFAKDVSELITYMRKSIKEHHMLYTNNPIVRGRMEDIGHLSKEQVISLGAGGPTGRASGWSCDVRKLEPYAAYDKVEFNEILHYEGMSFDRYIIRLDEIEESLNILEQLIDILPEGEIAAKTRPVIRLPEGEFFKRVENGRGQFAVHITSTGDRTPYRVKFRSPSMTLVSALREIVRAPKSNKVADLIMLGGTLDYIIPCIDR